MSKKCQHNFNLIALAIVLMSFFACKSEKKKDFNSVEEINKDEFQIVNGVINQLLDSNRYFLVEKFSFPITKNPPIDLSLAINDTLYSIESYGKDIFLLKESFDLDTIYSIINQNDCKTSKCVVVRISRICFKTDRSAFFQINLYRDPDFGKEDRVNLIRDKNGWRIYSIHNLWIS